MAEIDLERLNQIELQFGGLKFVEGFKQRDESNTCSVASQINKSRFARKHDSRK